METILEKSNQPTNRSITIARDIELEWKIIGSNSYSNESVLIYISQNESLKNLCHALSVVGVIGSVQLNNIFLRRNKKLLRIALERHVLRKHNMYKDGTLYPVYTLGVNGLMFSENNLERINYWMPMKKHQVLNSLTYYRLLSKFQKYQDSAVVSKSLDDSPFIGALSIRQSEFHVLILKGNENIIKNHIKYNYQSLPERMILVVEHLKDLDAINPYLKVLNQRIRVTTEANLEKRFEEMFYKLEGNEWVQTTS